MNLGTLNFIQFRNITPGTKISTMSDSNLGREPLRVQKPYFLKADPKYFRSTLVTQIT